MDRLFATLLNRLLADQPGAAERLRPHAGQVLRLNLPLLRIGLVVTADGTLAPAAAEAAPDCEIHLPAHLLLTLPLSSCEAIGMVQVSGDGVLAADLAALLRQLDWTVALAPSLGPVAAARADQALRALAQRRDEAGNALARSLTEYLVHEARLLAEGEAVREFVREVDELREAADRLAARLALLEDRHP